MPSDTLDPPKARAAVSSPASSAEPLLVRVDAGASDDAVVELLDVSIAVARGLGRAVWLVGSPGVAHGDRGPVDPVDWDLARRTEEARLTALVARRADERGTVDVRVPDRFARDELDVRDPVVALARAGSVSPWPADEALRDFLAAGTGSVLVVPRSGAGRDRARLERIVVPLDGSSRAECALPDALAIARQHAAELVFVHVAPEAPLIAGGALDADARALADALAERNRRAADIYLASLRERHADAGVALRTRLLDAGDARRRLVDVAGSERADLIVAAAHGASGHADVPSGTVASYVLEHAPMPVLMVGAGATPIAQERGASPEPGPPRPPTLCNGRR